MKSLHTHLKELSIKQPPTALSPSYEQSLAVWVDDDGWKWLSLSTTCSIMTDTCTAPDQLQKWSD